MGFLAVVSIYMSTSETWSNNTKTGPVEVGVQGVPRHTQYVAFHLVNTMFIPENLELDTFVHTQYSVASTAL